MIIIVAMTMKRVKKMRANNHHLISNGKYFRFMNVDVVIVNHRIDAYDSLLKAKKSQTLV